MNKLKLYRVNINYIKYLYKYDTRVQYNSNKEDSYTERRPYLGIALQVNNFNYFVPLEHPRPAHKQMKNNPHIFKIHNGKYGILEFNNMIPITKNQLIDFDINTENSRYRQILISQYHFCDKHIKEIRLKAESTYQKRKNNSFFKKICCNFELLEEKCSLYNK